MMRIFKIALIALVVFLISIPLLSCGSGAELAENQVVTVQRGDLTIDITGVGNLALSQKVDLAFEMDGTVEEVLVEEGESVEEGQLLAKLDTSAWEDQVTALERAVTKAERAVTTAERQVTSKELDLVQAQINLQTAEDNLDKVGEVAEANDAVEDAEWNLSITQAMFKQAGLSEMATEEVNFWNAQIISAQASLAEAQKELAEVLAGSSVKVTSDVALELKMKQLQIEIAQGRLEDAEIAVEDAKKGIEDAQIAVEDAKETLDEAKNTSPEIVAPFTGFITKVNVKGGDEVKKGTVAVTLADPNKFEADIMVNEMDIPEVKLGGNATVQVDALSGLSLSANVTHISPSATIQQGVVNYKVKVEIQSLEAIQQEEQQARQGIMEDISPEQISERLQQAIDAGMITQEQAEEMMKRIQESGIPFSSGGERAPMISLENFRLREGLTITVSIIVDESNDVLLVPNGAITTQGRQTYVQVVSPDGTIEERAITTGISDYQFTEVTEGLTEGEQIIVPQGTTTTSTTPTQQQREGIRIPGMGGFGR